MPNKTKYYYHATFPTRVESIRASGIDPRYNPFGVIFLCSSVEDIRYFTHGAFSRWSHEKSTTEKQAAITEHGEKLVLPKIIRHDKVAILQIDAGKLNPELLGAGKDHEPSVFPVAVYTYTETILPKWIAGIKYMPLGVKRYDT